MKNSRWLSLYAVAAYAFLHLPLAVLAVFSFNSSRFTRWEGFSLVWYKAAFLDTQLGEATLNSLLIALAATLLATAAGTLCAYGLWKRGSPWITTSLYLSLVTPEIVMGVALLALYQWIFRYLAMRLGMHTVILAHVMFCAAYVVTVVSAKLRTLDASLEEAAMDLGATEWQAFLRVTLPQLAPAVASAALLVFITSFDDYVITSLVAGVDSETLPMVIYAMARKGFNPSVNAISTLIVVALGVLILVSNRLDRSAKGTSRAPKAPGTLQRFAARAGSVLRVFFKSSHRPGRPPGMPGTREMRLAPARCASEFPKSEARP